VKLLAWSREENVCVNDTWSETINMKSRGKCFCECYTWSDTIEYEFESTLFVWMIHDEVKLLTRGKCFCECYTWSETIEYELRGNCLLFMWMLHEVKLLMWSREEIVHVNVTWSETVNMKYKMIHEVKLLTWSRE
jgi:hypothetical protein